MGTAPVCRDPTTIRPSLDGLTLSKHLANTKDQVVKAHFTLGVRAYVQPKSSIPIVFI
jgi:hypothetical protein